MKRCLAFLLLLSALVVTPPAVAQLSFLGLKNSLVDFALEQISVPGELELSAEGVEDAEDGATEIVGLEVADGDGVWLRIERLSLRWNASRVLRGELEINTLAATGVDVRRLPAASGVAVEVNEDAAIAQTDDDPFDWPRAPLAVRVDELRLDDVRIAEGIIAPQSLRFDANGAFRDEGDEQSLDLSVLRIDDVPGTILAEYLRDFANETLTLKLTAEEGAGGLVGTLAGLPPDSASQLNLSGTGPLNDWALTFDMNSDQVIAARGTAQLNAVAQLSATADFTLTPGSALSPAVQRALSPSAQLRIDVAEDDQGVIRINQGEVTAADLSLMADGSFNKGTSVADLNLVLDVDGQLSELVDGVDFASFGFDGVLKGPVSDLNAVGQLDLQGLKTAAADVGSADLNVDVQIADAITASVKGQASALRIDRLGSDLLGQVDLDLDAVYAGEKATLNLLSLTAKPLAFTVSGEADLGAEAVAIEYTLSSPDLAPIAAAYDVNAAGSIRAEGRIDGPFTAARLNGRVDLEQLAFNDEAFGRVALVHDAVFDETPSGNADLTADGSRFGEIAFNGDFELVDQSLSLTGLNAAGLGARIAGDISLDLDTTLAEGAIALDAPDLSLIGAAIDQTVSGGAAGDVQLSASEGAQNIVFDLALNRIAAAGAALAEGTLKASASDVRGTPAIDGTVRFGGLSAGGASIGSGNLAAKGDLEAMTINGDVSGIRSGEIVLSGLALDADLKALKSDDPAIRTTITARDLALGPATLPRTTLKADGRLSALKVSLDSAGTLSNEDPISAAMVLSANLKEELQATISTLRLTVKEGDEAATIALRQPLRVSSQGGVTRLNGIDIALPGGALTGDAAIQGAGLNGDLTMEIGDLVPLATLGGLPVEQGRIDLTARFDTRRARAGADISLSGSDIRFADIVADVGAVDLRSDIVWNGQRADVTASISGPFGDPVQISAGVPVRATNGPVPVLPPNGTLTGAIDWRGEISRFWALVPAPGHVLAGDTRIALQLGGTVADPAIGGDITISEGRYENLDVGTILVDLGVRTQVSSTGAFIVDLTANDGSGQPVEGRIEVADGSLDARIQATGATLVRRDDATASITLDISAKGPLDAPDIAGTVNIDKAEIRLIAANPPGIADLGEVRIKGEKVEPPAPPSGQEIDLNVDITAPQDVFVRGRGLDSEWEIDLEIRGTAAAPRIKGAIQKRRGTLDFLGRGFDLEEGTIQFNNSRIIDPRLNIQLLRENDGIVGGIAVSGTGRAPEIGFTSRPSLPEEEVLPRILFGRSKQSLSPTEALQLAVGVATLLDGSGGGVDGVRSAIGVDVLRIDGEGADTSVTVGSNVADGVFVGAKQPIGGGAASVQVEIDVFDNVTIDSEVGQDVGTSIGLNWKKDF